MYCSSGISPAHSTDLNICFCNSQAITPFSTQLCPRPMLVLVVSWAVQGERFRGQGESDWGATGVYTGGKNNELAIHP